MSLYVISDDGIARRVDIAEEVFAHFASLNPHVIHFMHEGTEEEL